MFGSLVKRITRIELGIADSDLDGSPVIPGSTGRVLENGMCYHMIIKAENNRVQSSHSYVYYVV